MNTNKLIHNITISIRPAEKQFHVRKKTTTELTRNGILKEHELHVTRPSIKRWN